MSEEPAKPSQAKRPLPFHPVVADSVATFSPAVVDNASPSPPQPYPFSVYQHYDDPHISYYDDAATYELSDALPQTYPSGFCHPHQWDLSSQTAFDNQLRQHGHHFPYPHCPCSYPPRFPQQGFSHQLNPYQHGGEEFIDEHFHGSQRGPSARHQLPPCRDETDEFIDEHFRGKYADTSQRDPRTQTFSVTLNYEQYCAFMLWLKYSSPHDSVTGRLPPPYSIVEIIKQAKERYLKLLEDYLATKEKEPCVEHFITKEMEPGMEHLVTKDMDSKVSLVVHQLPPDLDEQDVRDMFSIVDHHEPSDDHKGPCPEIVYFRKRHIPVFLHCCSFACADLQIKLWDRQVRFRNKILRVVHKKCDTSKHSASAPQNSPTDRPKENTA